MGGSLSLSSLLFSSRRDTRADGGDADESVGVILRESVIDYFIISECFRPP